MSLDDLDLDILRHMQDNARISLRQLGSKLGKPHTTIFTRVKRLEDEGYIKKFSAIIHPQDFGLKIGVFMIDAPPNKSKEIAQHLADLDEVNSVYRTYNGKIIANAVVPDLEGQKGFEEFLAKIDDHNLQVYPIDDIVKHECTIHEGALVDMKKKKE